MYQRVNKVLKRRRMLRSVEAVSSETAIETSNSSTAGIMFVR